MKLKDLIESGLVKDEDTLVIKMEGVPSEAVWRVEWFQDHILGLSEMKISEFSWSKKAGWRLLVSRRDALEEAEEA